MPKEILEKYRAVCPIFANMFWLDRYYEPEPLQTEVIEVVKSFRDGETFLQNLHQKTELMPVLKQPYFFVAMCIGFLEVMLIDEDLMLTVDNGRHLTVYLGAEQLSYDCHYWWGEGDAYNTPPLSHYGLQSIILHRYRG